MQTMMMSWLSALRTLCHTNSLPPLIHLIYSMFLDLSFVAGKLDITFLLCLIFGTLSGCMWPAGLTN